MAVAFQIENRRPTVGNRLAKEVNHGEFISLVNFTDQGIRNVKDSADRFEAFKAMAEKLGGTLKGVYYTMGHYDMVVIMEGSDEAAMTPC